VKPKGRKAAQKSPLFNTSYSHVDKQLSWHTAGHSVTCFGSHHWKDAG